MRCLGRASDQHNGVYCEQVCTLLPPAGTNNWRDDLIVLLDLRDVDRQVIADEFGITKQRVSQIVMRSI